MRVKGGRDVIGHPVRKHGGDARREWIIPKRNNGRRVLSPSGIYLEIENILILCCDVNKLEVGVNSAKLKFRVQNVLRKIKHSMTEANGASL